MALDDAPKKGKGVAWQAVNPKSLGDKLGKMHTDYLNEYDKAKQSGDSLKQAIQEKWDETYPTGIDGKRYVFNVLNGRVLYAPVPFKGLRALHGNAGADAFPQ